MIETKERPVKTLEKHRVSISSLNLLAFSPVNYVKHILEPEDGDTNYFRKGSMLDCLLTEPNEFNNRYAISRITPPGGMLGEFIKVYLHLIDRDAALSEDTIRRAAYADSGFKIKYESVIKKFEAQEIQNYIKFALESKGKTIVSEEEHTEAINMYNKLLRDPHIQKYLVTLPSNPLIDDCNQLKIEWKIEVEGKIYDCISILDKVLVDHNSKTIIPIDIKSTGKNVYSFSSSYIKYGYFRQAAFYLEAIKYWAKENEWEDYTIEPFRFIVVETHTTNKPLIYKVSASDINVGAFGGEKVKGFWQLLSQLKFHQDNMLWDSTPEVYKNEGELTLNILKDR